MRIASMRTVVLVAALSFLAVPATGQSFWLDHESGGVSLEVMRPTLSEGDLTFFSFAAFATAAARIGESTLLVVELPFSRSQPDFEGADAETALGNPYIGIQSAPAERTGLRGSIGARIPLASDGNLAATTGLLSAPTDRYEAFIPDLAAVEAAGRYVGALGEAAYAAARFGGVVEVPTDGGDVEFFAKYGAKVWTAPGELSAGLGVSGLYWVTSESELAFADRTLHELGLWIDYAFGGIRPGVRVQIPLGGELSDFVDQVVGLYVRYSLP